MTTPTSRIRSRPRPVRGGFTMIELAIVIVIIGILAALLLPAINSAVVRARNASVNSEINLLAQGLAAFKSSYGDYPPSRILLVENGDYSPFLTGNNATMTVTSYLATSVPSLTTPTNDITMAQLAQRSLQSLRRFWPRAVMGTTAPLAAGTIPGGFYDFNGSGGTTPDAPYILDGRECLVFFLGGIRTIDPNTGIFGMTGFARDPRNPFVSVAVSNNRSAPQFEFSANRLKLPPEKLTGTPPFFSGMPAYHDPYQAQGSLSFYAYFSAYGGAYDPNDVNANEPGDPTPGMYEMDLSGNSQALPFWLNFPPNTTISPPPNPYTNSVTFQNPTTAVAVSYVNSQSFQIIAPGVDSHYGAGGQYTPDAPSALPLEPPGSQTPIDRSYEKDNLTNFRNGRLD